MRYEDMTKREREISRISVCPFCNESINKIEDVQILKVKYGKRLIPFYIHTACLLNCSSQLVTSRRGIENAKEEIE